MKEAPTALFPPAAQHLLHFYLITQQDEPEAVPLISRTGLSPDLVAAAASAVCAILADANLRPGRQSAAILWGGNDMRGDEARGTQVKIERGGGGGGGGGHSCGDSESRRRK